MLQRQVGEEVAESAVQALKGLSGLVTTKTQMTKDIGK